MDWNKTYKIKDSVDIYLVDDQYILAYFMNTRLQKRFRVNDKVIRLFEEIDGNHTLAQIYDSFCISEEISKETFIRFFEKLLASKILCEKLGEHILDDYYLQRYDRQINYFTEFLDSELEAERALQRLINTRIGIIGCGSVGGDIAIQLAMSGVETFVLMDYDIIEESDSARHMFYSDSDIGKRKVIALSDKLKQINPKIKTYISCQILTPETDLNNFLELVDFVIDTADEPYLGYTANVISQACVPKRIPHYIAGGFDAHLASTGELIIPYVTPCAACYSSFFQKKLKDWRPEPHPVKARANEIGGLSSMSLFASSFACIEIIKYITGLMDMEKNYHKRAEFFFEGMNLVFLDPVVDPNCKVCGGNKNGV